MGYFSGPSPSSEWGDVYYLDHGPIMRRQWRGTHSLPWSTVVLPCNPYDADYTARQAAIREHNYLWGDGSRGAWGVDDEWSEYMIDRMSTAAR